MRYLFLLLCLTVLLPVQSADAQVALLIHGYASEAATWDVSGVRQTLAGRGWSAGGVIQTGPAGPVLTAWPVPAEATRLTYSVNLPAAASLGLQAQALRGAIDLLSRRHPGESVVLVGHSAGGVVARLALVGRPAGAVRTLITIASPHLGTERALEGLDVVESKPFFCPGPGFSLLKEIVGGRDYDYLQASRPLLYELAPAGLGNLLSWLNVQPHPPIEYISVVRSTPHGTGDEWVPGFSQDMNNVPALRGRATTHLVQAGHLLHAGDGALLGDILNGLGDN